ncbi:hypothetical protein K5X82_14110 [Halosquirtibacter xylanolyticus]|uniref:hypothetical protein n=1 Tax=Halosquirtibacter xylanolyticus TaxID=3374599 RepID=UPI003749E53E|nr:hypothetical protein K5X82_14110 [Prolixibacteraceae bacterium]
MIRINSRKYKNIYWFKEVLDIKDILGFTEIYQYQGVCNISSSFFKRKEFHTLKTDLTLSEDEIFASFRKKVRYEVRRSEKDNFEFHQLNNYSIDDFIDFYNVFAEEKNLLKLNRSSFNGMEDNLHFFYVKDDGLDKPMILRVFLVDRSSMVTRFLYEASCPSNEIEDRNIHGRSSKFLHWESIKYFKKHNFNIYDWGGIALKDDPITNGIDNFKRSFGGVQFDELHLISFPLFIITSIIRIFR